MKQDSQELKSTFFVRIQTMAMSENVEWSQEVKTTLHLIHSVRCMHGICPHNWYSHAYHITSGRCMRSVGASGQAIKPMAIEVDPWDPPDEPHQPDDQQPPDQPDHRTNTCRVLQTSQPDQHDRPDHPMPPAPPGVLPDSPVDPPLPPKPRGGPAGKRQKQSISSSSGLNRLGGAVPLPSQPHPSQPILLTVVSSPAKSKKPSENPNSPGSSPRNEPAASCNLDPDNPVNLPMRSDSAEELIPHVPTSSGTGSSQRTWQYTDQQDGESEDSQRTRPFDDQGALVIHDSRAEDLC